MNLGNEPWEEERGVAMDDADDSRPEAFMHRAVPAEQHHKPASQAPLRRTLYPCVAGPTILLESPHRAWWMLVRWAS